MGDAAKIGDFVTSCQFYFLLAAGCWPLVAEAARSPLGRGYGALYPPEQRATASSRVATMGHRRSRWVTSTTSRQ